jgi:hypothetical protein
MALERLHWKAFAGKNPFARARVRGIFMAKRVSATELLWLITEALREEQPTFATSLAVVSDEKVGWRTVIASASRNRVDRKLSQILARVEGRLRREYSLAN